MRFNYPTENKTIAPFSLILLPHMTHSIVLAHSLLLLQLQSWLQPVTGKEKISKCATVLSGDCPEKLQ